MSHGLPILSIDSAEPPQKGCEGYCFTGMFVPEHGAEKVAKLFAAIFNRSDRTCRPDIGIPSVHHGNWCVHFKLESKKAYTLIVYTGELSQPTRYATWSFLAP